MRALIAALLCFATAHADPPRYSHDVQQFVSVDSDVFALTHVRVIDGTGSPPRDDQTIVVSDGKVLQVGPSAEIRVPPSARVLDKRGYTVFPGLVGMHDHLFYSQFDGPLLHDIPISATRLYLASGVTTIRTAGAINPYLDLGIQQRIDSGQLPGPKVYVTGPYLEGKGAFSPQMPELTSIEAVRKTIEFWTALGVTSFKVYARLPKSLAAAAIEAAHRHGLKVTAHLCAVTFSEAIKMGIDNIEHGLPTSTDFDPGKQPDVCPDSKSHLAAVAALKVDGPRVQALIADMISHKVALTSTLAVYESHLPGRAHLLRGRVAEALAPQAFLDAVSSQLWVDEPDESFRWYRDWEPVFRNEMKFERAFVRAGGLLMAGADPTGDGGVLPGFADQREIELLVQAGFSVVDAIKIATHNGALFLGIADHVGTIANGKQADLVLVRGNPVDRIQDLENVEIVFKKGIGFDSESLIRSVRGKVGIK